MSQGGLDPTESRLLEESMRSDFKDVNIRLRKGNFQYDLAKGIASFQLELRFPDVKDIIERLYGEEKNDEPQFVRKIQTILKKMEKNDVVRILLKQKPWELQRYALLSFKFIDVDKKPIILATPEEINRAQKLLNSTPSPQQMPAPNSHVNTKILLSTTIIAASYILVLWSLLQPIIQLFIFVPAFCTAIAFSVVLGKLRASSRNTDSRLKQDYAIQK